MPKELYEVGQIDGAGDMDEVWMLTMESFQADPGGHSALSALPTHIQPYMMPDRDTRSPKIVDHHGWLFQPPDSAFPKSDSLCVLVIAAIRRSPYITLYAEIHTRGLVSDGKK